MRQGMRQSTRPSVKGKFTQNKDSRGTYYCTVSRVRSLGRVVLVCPMWSLRKWQAVRHSASQTVNHDQTYFTTNSTDLFRRCSPRSAEHRNIGVDARTRPFGSRRRERRTSPRFARLHSASLLRIFAGEMKKKASSRCVWFLRGDWNLETTNGLFLARNNSHYGVPQSWWCTSYKH